MYNILRTILISAAVLAAFTPAKAAVQAEAPKVYDVAVAVNEQDSTVSVAIELLLRELSLKSDGELIFTPVIISADGGESLELDPVTVCGRNRWYFHLRNKELEVTNPSIFRAGADEKATMVQIVPFEAWMDHCTVELRQEAATCCRAPEIVGGTSPNGNTELAVIDTERPDLIKEFIFAPPVDDTPVEKNIEGKAFVSFVVNRTELKPDYMVNRREIAKIINSIDYVRNDSDAVITGVHIKGFASPEGSYTNNIRLAKGRTATLSAYVRDLYHFDEGIVTNSFEPEDWEGLRSYVKDSLDYNIAHREEILAMIDSPIDPDVKNDLIKRTYPADYQLILKEIYPWLRHSDYTVKYRIKIYTDINNLNRLFESDPTRLRPVDFYTIAAQYPEGSEEYLKVMQTAVEVYTEDPMLNLNAANIAFMADENDKAEAYLAKAGTSPEASFARGVLAARRGHFDEAKGHFGAAKNGGLVKADDYLQNIESIRNYHPVTITVKLLKKA